MSLEDTNEPMCGYGRLATCPRHGGPGILPGAILASPAFLIPESRIVPMTTPAQPSVVSNMPTKPATATQDSADLLAKARDDADAVLMELGSQPDGLSEAEAATRLQQAGTNEIAREHRQSNALRLLGNINNPLVLLLLALAVLSFLTGDQRATAVILVMVVLGVVLRFVQEMRADNAAEKLKAMVSTTATLIRGGKEQEVPLKLLVPGDIICLSAGDMVPADVSVLVAKDLFVNQSALTGEALPVESKPRRRRRRLQTRSICPTCFLGSNVESGTGTAVVVHTGEIPILARWLPASPASAH